VRRRNAACAFSSGDSSQMMSARMAPALALKVAAWTWAAMVGWSRSRRAVKYSTVPWVLNLASQGSSPWPSRSFDSRNASPTRPPPWHPVAPPGRELWGFMLRRFVYRKLLDFHCLINVLCAEFISEDLGSLAGCRNWINNLLAAPTYHRMNK
jgi:hypothetical protein